MPSRARLLIGITAGLISLVPYLGAGVGLVVALCIAAARLRPDGVRPIVVGGIFLVGEPWPTMCCLHASSGAASSSVRPG